MGGTNIDDAIRKTNAELSSSRHRSDAEKIVVLLSDGAPNCYDTGPTCYEHGTSTVANEWALARADEGWSAGETFYAIGFSFDADASLLQQIARDEIDPNPGGERYFGANDPNALEEAFQNIATKIQIETTSTTPYENVKFTSYDINASQLLFEENTDSNGHPFLNIKIVINVAKIAPALAYRRAEITLQTTISSRAYKNIWGL